MFSLSSLNQTILIRLADLRFCGFSPTTLPKELLYRVGYNVSCGKLSDHPPQVSNENLIFSKNWFKRARSVDRIFLIDLETRFECPTLNFFLRKLNKFLFIKFFAVSKLIFSNFKVFSLSISNQFFVSFMLNLSVSSILKQSALLLVSNSFRSKVSNFGKVLFKIKGNFSANIFFQSVPALNVSILTNLAFLNKSDSLAKYKNVYQTFAVKLEYGKCTFNTFCCFNHEKKVFSVYYSGTFLLFISSHRILFNNRYFTKVDVSVPVLPKTYFEEHFFDLFGVKKKNTRLFSSLNFLISPLRIFNILQNFFYSTTKKKSSCLKSGELSSVLTIKYTTINSLLPGVRLKLDQKLVYKTVGYFYLSNSFVYNFYKTCQISSSSVSLQKANYLTLSLIKNYYYLI